MSDLLESEKRYMLFIRDNIRNQLLILIILISLDVTLSHAKNIFEYQTYYESKGERIKNSKPVDSFSIMIGELKDNRRTVTWSKQEGKEYNDESYQLDQEWATLQWEVVDSKESLNYSATRDGNTLLLDGVVKNKEFKKEIIIDEDPFYYNPKLGLRHLVDSKSESMTFWAMRHDNLDAYKMKAIKKGKETIKVNGRDVEAVRIEWSAVNGFSKYFTRTYWFRCSDGNYVKQKVSGSKVRGLMNER